MEKKKSHFPFMEHVEQRDSLIIEEMRKLPRNSRWVHTDTITLEGREEEIFQNYLPPEIRARGERIYLVTENDLLRPDLISYKVYNDPSLWWVIAQYNKIRDVYNIREGDRLRIPNYSLEEPLFFRGFETNDCPAVVNFRTVGPPPYEEINPENATDTSNLLSSFIHNVSFTFPKCLVGRVHFELQMSRDREHLETLLFNLSSISPENWYYYNAEENEHVSYPKIGLLGEEKENVSIYFGLTENSGVIKNQEYYLRYRPLVLLKGILQKGKWVNLPPFSVR